MKQERLNQKFREQVLNGSLAIAENLFAQGANPDYVYSDGKTLLGILAEKGDLDKIKFLVETCNADPRVKDKGGKTAFDSATSYSVRDYLDQKESVRHTLNFNFVQDVLGGRFREAREKFKKGANPNEGYGSGNLNFVLLDAALAFNLPAIRFLVEEAGANPNVITKGEKSILETVREHATSDTATDRERRVLKCLEDAIWRKEHPFLARFRRKPTGDELIVDAPSTEPVVHSGHTGIHTVVSAGSVPAEPKGRLSAIGRVGVILVTVGAGLFLFSNHCGLRKTEISSGLVGTAETPQTPAGIGRGETQSDGSQVSDTKQAAGKKVDHDAAKVARQIQYKLSCREQERRAMVACTRTNSPFCALPKCGVRGK